MEEILKKFVVECLSPLTIFICISVLVCTGCYFIQTITKIQYPEDKNAKLVKKIAKKLGIKEDDE